MQLIADKTPPIDNQTPLILIKWANIILILYIYKTIYKTSLCSAEERN